MSKESLDKEGAYDVVQQGVYAKMIRSKSDMSNFYRKPYYMTCAEPKKRGGDTKHD